METSSKTAYTEGDLRLAVGRCVVFFHRLSVADPDDSEIMAAKSALLLAARHAGQLLMRSGNTEDKEAVQWLADLNKLGNKPRSLELVAPSAGRGAAWHLDRALAMAERQQRRVTEPQLQAVIKKAHEDMRQMQADSATAYSNNLGKPVEVRQLLFAAACKIDLYVKDQDTKEGRWLLDRFIEHARLAVTQSSSFAMKHHVLQQILHKTSRRLACPGGDWTPPRLCRDLLVALETDPTAKDTIAAASDEETAEALMGTGICALHAMVRAGSYVKCMAPLDPTATTACMQAASQDLATCQIPATDPLWTTNRWYLMVLDSMTNSEFELVTPQAPDTVPVK